MTHRITDDSVSSDKCEYIIAAIYSVFVISLVFGSNMQVKTWFMP